MDHFLFKRAYHSGYFDFFNFMARVTIQPKRHEISARCPKMTNLMFFWNFSLKFFIEIVFLKLFFEILQISRKNFKKKFQKKFFWNLEIFFWNLKISKKVIFSNHRNFPNFKKSDQILSIFKSSKFSKFQKKVIKSCLFSIHRNFLFFLIWD